MFLNHFSRTILRLTIVETELICPKLTFFSFILIIFLVLISLKKGKGGGKGPASDHYRRREGGN